MSKGKPPSLPFFFNDTATTEIYTLSLHDALPICSTNPRRKTRSGGWWSRAATRSAFVFSGRSSIRRSEEHTSELQSQSNLVCRLLLEKKKMLAPAPQPSGAPLGRPLELLSNFRLV